MQTNMMINGTCHDSKDKWDVAKALDNQHAMGKGTGCADT